MIQTTVLPGGISYHIEQTPSGWMLVLQNAHCTLSQVFQSASAAQQGIGPGASTLEGLTRQHLARPAASILDL